MRTFTALALCLPTLAFAAGSDDSTPPTPTETTTTCEEGYIWDDEQSACVVPEESQLDDDSLIEAVRELAYAGRINDAQDVLDHIGDQDADMVLTYRGFTARKSGDLEAADRWYKMALVQNPNNHLARSYMAQGMVAQGQYDLARAELHEIRARGGRGGWADMSLALALRTGTTSSY